MKNLVRSLVVVASVGLFSTSLSAATLVVQDTVVEDTIKKEDPKNEICMVADEVTYSKIELTEIPEAVNTAVAAKYEGAVVEEAYKGSDNSFKLTVKKEDSKITAYFTEAGEFVKEEALPAETGLVADEVTYAKIEVAEIPQAVSTALATKYEGATVEEAFKGTDNSFKLVIKKEENKLTVYFTEAGEFVKEEACPAES